MSSHTPFKKAAKHSSSMKSEITTRSKSVPSHLANSNLCLKIIQDYKKSNYETFASGYFMMFDECERLFDDVPLTMHS